MKTAKPAALLAAALFAAAIPSGGAVDARPDAPIDLARCVAAPAPPASSETPSARPGWLPRGESFSAAAPSTAGSADVRLRHDALAAPPPPGIARWTLSHGTSTSLP